LEGTHCNRAAIGARLKVTFQEKGTTRSVFRDVNSGGSFGSSPLRQHIGIGQATTIQSIEIKWPGNSETQIFKNVQPGQNLKIKEGSNSYSKIQLRKVDYLSEKSHIISCSPK
ncbi:MAG TPA: ASPIC/UnbV domain-containing protein, partial [Chitinophagaceae bacterium]|nr:ASPIC/UnbV domain-containing protein [Chitinophagaceae bacterium]